MISSGFIPLVRAKGFGPFPAMLEERAGERALFETFEAEGIPVALRDSPTTPMPLSAMMALLTRAAHRLGDRTFGLEVGERMTHRGYGLWIEYSTAAETLGEALQRGTTTSWAQQSGCRLELAADGERRTLRFIAPRTGVSEAQHADHLLPPMLTFARLYLGRTWKPDWVEVTYARDPGAGLVEDRLQIPVRFNRQGTGIVLRAADLTRTRPLGTKSSGRIVTLRDVRADVLLMDAPEPARALSAVVALRLLDGQCDIEGAAHAIGLSVQGLQRRLRQKGYTYREILDLARRARAVRLLLETPVPIVEIALSLGYEDHANFTRAFIRWEGCSPSEFRQARRRFGEEQFS